MMQNDKPGANKSVAAIDGAMALIVVLLVTQMWLLSATLDAYLAGHHDSALPGALVSGLLLLGCFGLYRFVIRLEKRENAKRWKP